MEERVDNRSKTKAGVRQNGPTGGWSATLDHGRRPAFRCNTCNARVWAGARPVTACPRCGGTELRQTRERRWEGLGTFPTQRAARAALVKAQADLNAGLRRPKDNMTLGQYLTEVWLPSIENGKLKATTVNGYKSHVRNHLTMTSLGLTALQDLTPQAITTFLNGLQENGRRDGSAKRLSASSVRRIHATLARALHDAVRNRLLAMNPAADLPDLCVPEPPERTVWSSDELRTFLDATKDTRLGDVWATMALTGLRRGELCGLRWRDVDLRHDVQGRMVGALLTIAHTIIQLGSATSASTPKSKRGARRVAVGPKAAALLERQRRWQEQDRALAGDWRDSGHVFTREDGGYLHPDDLTWAFVAAVRQSGLPPVRLHDLRHAHGTILANEQGVAISQVSGRLGHASTAFTGDTYVHPLEAQDAAIAVAFEDLILPDS